MCSSVIVVVCQRHPWLKACVESAAAQADEVVLVDNGSPDRWATEEGNRLGARVVSLDRNIGFPAGVNVGLGVASGEMIALLNDDAIAGDEWLKQAGAVLSDPTVGAVTPKLLLAWPHAAVRFDDEPWSAPGDPRPLGRQLHSATVGGQDVLATLAGKGLHGLEEQGQGAEHHRWRWTVGRSPFYVPLLPGTSPGDILINGEPVEPVRVVDVINNAGSYLSAEGHIGDYGFETADGPHFDIPADRFAACGAALVARAETFRRLGGLAASFFAYYEDSDWCWRAQLAGLSVRYEPRAVVRHVRGVSTGGNFSRRVKFLAARNRLHCLARNAPLGLLQWQVRRSREPGHPTGLGRAVAARVSKGLVERRLLARRWTRSPGDVFTQWAGVGERWPDATE